MALERYITKYLLFSSLIYNLINMKKVELSLLALKEDKKIKETLFNLRNQGIEYIHYDVMDNIFVPNTAFEGEYIELIRSLGFKISVHLMVQDIRTYVAKFLKYNIDYLTFHFEEKNEKDVIEMLDFIHSKNVKAGLAIKPKTSLNELNKYIDKIDILTVMTVEPGFGGQKFIESSLTRLNEIKNLSNSKFLIQVDGGVNGENISQVAQYANLIVSGSYLSKCNDIPGILKEIQED